jgi:hypothetical protein
MKRRPIATVRVLPLNHLAEGTIRVEIDCPASMIGYTQVPSGPLNCRSRCSSRWRRSSTVLGVVHVTRLGRTSRGARRRTMLFRSSRARR